MTPRERINSVIRFKKPDVLPWIEVFEIETILKWIREGLPADELAVIDWKIQCGSLLNEPTLFNGNLTSRD